MPVEETSLASAKTLAWCLMTTALSIIGAAPQLPFVGQCAA
jgi:hypothetical protein